ncbi:glycosyltransferase family 4 protein [Microbacterium sp. F51-2R]|uniref:glycosyltransferase family 4 protein n=1 Tax=Microbacterium sp. F51-2R TaxID=3445777 RepID=UPI003FA10C45
MYQQVAFTQPYVPTYRVPLFDELAKRLKEQNRELTVYSGQPEGEQATRRDSASGAWHRPLDVKAIRVARWSVESRNAPAELRAADLLVSELSALNGIAWRQSFTSQPLVLWGHGKSYVNDSSWLGDRIEWTLARRADHIMTYANGGREFLLTEGKLPADKVTAIGNSTDTAELRSAYNAAVDSGDATAHGNRRQVLFVGALDSTKRLDFVLEAFDHAVQLDPEMSLVVAGEGAMADQVDALAQRDPRVQRVGDVRGSDLARIGAASSAVWMPGRVGLVAVDALALGLPIHTTPYRYHAPEVEFLMPGEIEYLADDPKGFAVESISAMDRGRPALRNDIPSIQSVASNMAEVIDRQLRK